MEMWNWLMDCYEEGSLTIDELEIVMREEDAARKLWDDWASDSGDFVDIVRDEVSLFVKYIKGSQERMKKNDKV